MSYILITGNANSPIYREAEWTVTNEYSGTYKNGHSVKCIHKDTGEICWFTLEEVCGF